MENEAKREQLQREIADTTHSLRNKMERLEGVALQTVEEISEDVKQTADTIRERVQNMSVAKQMEKRPGTVLAASVGAGVMLGLRSGMKRQAMRTVGAAAKPALGRVIASSMLARAASSLTPLALGVGLSLVGTWAKKRYPNSEPYFDKIESLLLPRI